MIEVTRVGGLWRWALICPAGRALVYSGVQYASDLEANEAAKNWRTAFWAVADAIDHRQAQCI